MTTQPQKATIHFPPTYPPLRYPSILFFGTIEPSPTTNWTAHLTTQISHLPIQILNPRRDDWDSTWREEVDFAPFHETVQWDMFHAERASLIVFCFKAGSLSPISMMELGMYAALYGGVDQIREGDAGAGAGAGRAAKVVVCCEEGFYKKGHVHIICGRFGVPCVSNLEELGRVVRERMKGLCEGGRVE